MLIERAVKVQRRSKRSTLTVDDLNFALSQENGEVTGLYPAPLSDASATAALPLAHPPPRPPLPRLGRRPPPLRRAIGTARSRRPLPTPARSASTASRRLSRFR